MDPKRIAQYARMCRREGITSLTIGDVSLVIDLTHETSERRRPSTAASTESATESKAPSIEVTEPTEEEMLYWSSQG